MFPQWWAAIYHVVAMQHSGKVTEKEFIYSDWNTDAKIWGKVRSEFKGMY